MRRNRSIPVPLADACKSLSAIVRGSGFCLSWLKSPKRRCYWWPFELKNPDGSAALFGLNTRNMDPLEIYHVNRKIERAWLFEPIKNKDSAHADDQAKY